MNDFKINVNRPTITSEEIESKQNFNEVLTKFNQASVPVYKNPWFWGSAGLASLGLTTVLTLNALTPNKNAYDENNTLKSSKNLPPDTECVKPPVKDENIPYQVFEVKPNEDKVLTLESGTTIEIDAESLKATDKSKNVEIKVREFHDQASVFISGIPMDYQKSAFESAGMIEITGEQDSKTVAINPEKPLEVNMQLHEDPQGFDFWFLNKKTAAWEKHDVDYKSEENVSTDKASLKTLQKEKVDIEKKLDQNATAIKNNAKPKTEEFNIPKRGSQQFDIDFDKKDFPELQAYKNLIFEVTSYGGHDPSFVENSNKTWNSMELMKNQGKYHVRFKNAREEYVVAVRPVLQGKELKDAERDFDAAIVSYEQKKVELEKEQKRLKSIEQQNKANLDALVKQQLASQENARRNQVNQELVQASKVNQSMAAVAGFDGTANFSLNKWGIYNCDKPKAYPEALKNQVIFSFVGGALIKIKELFVFNLDKKNRYSYGTASMPLTELGFHKNDAFVMVAVDEEGNIAYSELKKDVNLDELHQLIFKKKQNDESTFALLKKLLDENPALS